MTNHNNTVTAAKETIESFNNSALTGERELNFSTQIFFDCTKFALEGIKREFPAGSIKASQAGTGYILNLKK